MAFTTSFDRPAAPLRIRERLSTIIDAARAARRRHSDYTRVRRELSQMSDAELNDIGIGRGDIAAIAREHASG